MVGVYHRGVSIDVQRTLNLADGPRTLCQDVGPTMSHMEPVEIELATIAAKESDHSDLEIGPTGHISPIEKPIDLTRT